MVWTARLAGLLLAVTAGCALAQEQQQSRGPFPELEEAIEKFDLPKLPPHPRMVLTPPEMERVRSAVKSEWGKPFWNIIRRYVDGGRSNDPPAIHGKWNVTDWRRIVAVGDEY